MTFMCVCFVKFISLVDTRNMSLFPNHKHFLMLCSLCYVLRFHFRCYMYYVLMCKLDSVQSAITDRVRFIQWARELIPSPFFRILEAKGTTRAPRSLASYQLLLENEVRNVGLIIHEWYKLYLVNTSKGIFCMQTCKTIMNIV